MSQYLNLSIKSKENEDVNVCLFWLCTTPARTLSNIGAFPYVSEDTKITEDLFNQYIGYINDEVEDYKKNLAKHQNRLSEFQKNLPLAQNKEVYECIMDDIDDTNIIISEIKAEIDDFEGYIRNLKYVLDIYKDNSEKWDLYYTNC